MIDKTPRQRAMQAMTPTSPLRICNPLDFIFEDHLRLRVTCAKMDHLADADCADRQSVAARRRGRPLAARSGPCEPEDDLPKLADRLEREHSGIVAGAQEVLQGLRARLTDLDLASMRDAMIARHGLDSLFAARPILGREASETCMPSDFRSRRHIRDSASSWP